MIFLWLYLAGIPIAWWPVTRYLIRDTSGSIQMSLDMSDVAACAALGALCSLFWPALAAWQLVRPFVQRGVDRINADLDAERLRKR